MDRFLTSGNVASRHHLLLAHGAGAPMTSPVMDLYAASLADQGLCIHRFEFGYMAERRKSGARRPPPKAERLIPAYRDAIANWRNEYPSASQLFIGGKSLGGRVASLLASEASDGIPVAGLVCLGYPFHPPGQPEKLRTAHLMHLTCPGLIVQGTRDPFGTATEVRAYKLPPGIEVHWIEDGDHDLRPPVRSGRSFEQAVEQAAIAVAAFMRDVPLRRKPAYSR